MCLLLNGRGERIRTSDLTVPNRALYQAEPRPDRYWILWKHQSTVKPRSPRHMSNREPPVTCQTVIPSCTYSKLRIRVSRKDQYDPRSHSKRHQAHFA